MKNHYLVIDQGGHGTRAIIFNADGQQIFLHHEGVSTDVLKPGFVEQGVDEILSSLDLCLHAVAQQGVGEITAAALIVQRSSFIACSDLSPITHVISWQDTRNLQLIENLRPHHGMIREKTGLYANAHYGASKMRWLLDNEAAVQLAADQERLLFVPLAAFIANRLVNGESFVVDPVIASRTMLCQLGAMAWDQDLLDLFGISSTYLPDIVSSDFPVGEIIIGHQRVPLQLVGGDQSFIPFASGVELSNHDVFINAGTGAFIQTQITDYASIDQRLLCSPAVITHAETIIMSEGTVNAAASALDWLWETEQQQLDIFDINKALDDIQNPPLFINTVAGTGSPYWLKQQDAKFFVECSNMAEKAVAVFESIVFALMDNFYLMQQGKPDLDRIIISGGLSNFDGFCQKIADLSGLRVVRFGNHEASARGAAIYLMHREKLSHQHEEVFSPCSNMALQRRYQAYVKLINGYS